MFFRLLKGFREEKSGSTSIIAGLLFTMIVGAVGAAVDISSLQNTDSKLQRAMDGASLAAARSYRESEDRAASIALAENFFDTAVGNMPRVIATREFSVSKDTGSGDITATGHGFATLDGYFMKNLLTAGIASETVLSAKNPDLYLYFMIDATGSMAAVIDGVRDATKTLEAAIRTRLDEEQIEIDRVLAKIGFFRDLRIEESRPAWIESPVYDLAVESDVDAMYAMLDSEPAIDGGDTPESSLAAIGEALVAPLPSEIEAGNVIQVTVLWTDAPSLDLGATDGSEDITVALWKRFGSPDTQYSGSFHNGTTIVRDWHEADVRTWPSPNPDDGCCATFSEIETAWISGGTVLLENRRLGIRAPSGEYPWSMVAAWPNTNFENYSSPSGGADIIDDVISALQIQYSPLRVSH